MRFVSKLWLKTLHPPIIFTFYYDQASPGQNILHTNKNHLQHRFTQLQLDTNFVFSQTFTLH